MDSVIQKIGFDERVAALLKDGALPTDDLSPSSNVVFFGCSCDDELCGVVGLEVYGSCALLRSLAVAPGHRNDGIGGKLLAHAEDEAEKRGAREIYLLTTTAEPYFSRRGYTRVERASAPTAIAATRQFSDLCPSSSSFMVKKK